MARSRYGGAADQPGRQDYLLVTFSSCWRHRRPWLLTDQMVLGLIEEGWSERDPTTDLGLLSSFTEALRALLDDQVPIARTDELLDEFAPMHQQETDLGEALARLRMLPGVRESLPGNRPGDRLLRLDPAIERQLADSLIAGPSGVLWVPPDVLHNVSSAIRTLITDRSEPNSVVVLVVGSSAIRRMCGCS